MTSAIIDLAHGGRRFLLAHATGDPRRERLGSLFAMIALVGWSTTVLLSQETAAITDAVMLDRAADANTAPRGGASGARAGSHARREILAGGYGGVSYTHPSTVEIRNPGRTDMTLRDFPWLGLPFKSPIYYGLRAISRRPDQRFGVMLDFTHAKAIADANSVGTFSGTVEGKPLPAKAKVGDVFKHLEFSHGHNIVTVNGLASLGLLMPRIAPYVGIGAGVALPHTEIGFRAENGRTYEYQYAGLVAQGLAGVEIKLGVASVFVEYKFSYAPYEVPLSGVVNGWLLVTDIWRQLRAWIAREAPSGGTLRTHLATHHGIAGVLVRVRAASVAGAPATAAVAP